MDDTDPTDPTEAERAGLREICRCELTIKQLTERCAYQVKPLLENTKRARETISGAAFDTDQKCVRVHDTLFARIKQAATQRRISPEVIAAAVDALPDEEPLPPPKTHKKPRLVVIADVVGIQEDSKTALCAALVEGVRRCRTSYHDALQLLVKLPKTVDATQVQDAPAAVVEAYHYLTRETEVVKRIRATVADEKKAHTAALRAAHAVVVPFMLRRRKAAEDALRKDEKLCINFHPDLEDADVEPFELVLIEPVIKRRLGAKEFAAVAHKIIVENGICRQATRDWRQALTHALVAAVQGAELQGGAATAAAPNGGLVLQARRQRGRKIGSDVAALSGSSEDDNSSGSGSEDDD